MKILLLAIAFIVGNLSAAAKDGPLLSAQTPIALPGKAGQFDFMATDVTNLRILAAHTETNMLEILDLRTEQVRQVEVGAAQGVAVDEQGHRYFLGDESDQKIVILDSQTFEKIAEIKVDGPVDAISFDAKNGLLYAGKDESDYIWVIDTNGKKLVTKIMIPGAPEVVEYDRATDHVYQNVRSKNSVVRINPETNQIDATWSTLPATSPNGLAVDSKRGRVYVAGSNGKLISIDLATGKQLSAVNIAPGADQIAYDSEKQIIYCACKGFISIAKAEATGLQSLGNVVAPKGAHTLSINPATHDVWISYADSKHSYLQKFKALE